MIRTLGLLAIAALAACETQLGDNPTEVSEPGIPATTGAVEAGFRAGPWIDGEQTVWVRLSGREGRVGSFQGRLSFDASLLQLVEAIMTDAAGGRDFGILNSEGSESGALRFAGFSIEGFEVKDVLSARFLTPRALRAGDLALALDVVGTAEGAQLSEANLAIVPAMRPTMTLELGR